MLATVSSTLRVYQWPKNLVVFGALVFAQQFHDASQVTLSMLAFVALCAASSAVYVFNDLRDVERDRAHPEKRRRPIASGTVSPPAAISLFLALVAASLALAFALELRFGVAVLTYLVLMTLYTLLLKQAIILDILVVAIGFVIRAIAGALVLNVVFSNWLVVCTLFLALFLSLGKRRQEIALMERKASGHREVLSHYTVPLLDSLMTLTGGAALLTYTIYTCSPEVVARLGTDKLYMTLPFVVYGLFRYFYLVHLKGSGGDPSRTLIKDLPTLVTVLLWGLVSMAIIWWGPVLHL
ncbi:MAG: decaprenyl-phosphate phosphoribosyltransferase [bacterium]|nr:decaprenyl-phosphate phosphoribosyltransferase [bacterium]